MTRFFNAALTASAAIILSLASIGAIVTVPPAQAEMPATLALPLIA